MATQLLLVEDVDALGRSGEIVTVKPGYARNFLLPQGIAIIANKQALRQQERLKQERQTRAIEDKKESEAIASHIEGVNLITVVKVDHEGHMYGSVHTHEIVNLLQEQKNVSLDKKSVLLKHPIKTTGVHPITVKLKEGVTVTFNLKVMSEEEYRTSQELVQ
ncbi:MAG: 50S ribosomal protein L9 [Parachlamydiaceae bacterium]